MIHHKSTFCCTLLVTAALLVGCGQNTGTPGGTEPTPGSATQPEATLDLRATSTSRTSVLVTLGSVTASAGDPGRYTLRGEVGAVPVLSAYVLKGDQRVLLVTGAQGAAPLTLTAGGKSATFKPVATDAPILASAAALSSTQVLLRLALPDGTPATLDPAAVLNGTVEIGGLEVRSLALGDALGTVVATTAAQAEQDYTVKAGGLYTTGLAPLAPASATVSGLAAKDTTPPRVTGVIPVDSRHLLVDFSEPLGQPLPANFGIVDAGGQPVSVSLAEYMDGYQTRVMLTTGPQQAGSYRLTVSGVKDVAGNVLSKPAPIDFAGRGEEDTVAPLVRSVKSSGNTSITVTFSEPMRGGKDGAENPALYSFSGEPGLRPQTAALTVTAARLSADRLSVDLTTLSQSDIKYTLNIGKVTDLAGNPVDITRSAQNLSFVGTPASGGGTDTDGDGLNDDVEQRGWLVTVTDAAGRRVGHEVTSDPTLGDTDGDGLSDKDERAQSLDPRKADTDADDLGDAREATLGSSGAMQDTDVDGLIDGDEVNTHRTSVTLADTDGDQVPDGEETTVPTRSPRIAEIPLPRITVRNLDVRLDTSIVTTDTQGRSTSTSKSVTKSLSTETTDTYSKSDSDTNSSFFEASATVGFEAGFPGAGVNGSLTATGGFSQDYTTTLTQESSKTAQQGYEESLDQSTQYDESVSVTREVRGGEVVGLVEIGNASSIPYTISNLEILVSKVDPENKGKLIPLGTLQNASGNNTFNLGPLTGDRGPFAFKDTTPFASTLEGFLKAPTGLVFQISNYDITDEKGRNFAYTSRELTDKTAEIVLDGPDANGKITTRRYRVATTGLVDAQGRARTTVTLGEVLRDVLKVPYERAGTNITSIRLDGRDVRNETGTFRWPDGQNRTGTVAGWLVQTNATVPTGLGDIDNLVIESGDSVSIGYFQDRDLDKISDREEFLYGTSDTDPDTDGDAREGAGFDARFTDHGEIRGQRNITVEFITGKRSYRMFPNPARANSDADALEDSVELNGVRTRCTTVSPDGTTFLADCPTTDPAKTDTDEDGLNDAAEREFYTVKLRNGSAVRVSTSPVDQDTDDDGTPDGAEVRMGTNPVVYDKDSDRDGLADDLETQGWDIDPDGVGGAPAVRVTSDPRTPDADGDHLPDVIEQLAQTDPKAKDSDGDGLLDWGELNLRTLFPVGGVSDVPFETFKTLCQTLYGCRTTYVENPKALGTKPGLRDTDGDTVADDRELRLDTDPTVADKKISVSWVRMWTPGDCEGGVNGNSQWEGEFDILPPSGVRGLLFNVSALRGYGEVGSASDLLTDDNDANSSNTYKFDSSSLTFVLRKVADPDKGDARPAGTDNGFEIRSRDVREFMNGTTTYLSPSGGGGGNTFQLNQFRWDYDMIGANKYVALFSFKGRPPQNQLEPCHIKLLADVQWLK